MEEPHNLKIIKLNLMLIPLAISVSALYAQAQTACEGTRVCLTVVSQQKLSRQESSRLSPSTRTTSVRLRLFNGSANEIAYLAGIRSIEPDGFRLTRGASGEVWRALPEAAFRSVGVLAGPGNRPPVYLRLAAKTAIEFDEPDWGNPVRDTETTEHAFSIFIQVGGPSGTDRPIELISESFHPLPE